MLLPTITLDGSFGQRVDYTNVRIGHGGSFVLTTSLRPTSHLELAASIDHEWLDVVDSRQLYAADIDRLKATCVFNARSLARLMVERVRNIAVDLRPAQLDDFGLYAALRTLCAEQARPHRCSLLQ